MPENGDPGEKIYGQDEQLPLHFDNIEFARGGGYVIALTSGKHGNVIGYLSLKYCDDGYWKAVTDQEIVLDENSKGVGIAINVAGWRGAEIVKVTIPDNVTTEIIIKKYPGRVADFEEIKKGTAIRQRDI